MIASIFNRNSFAANDLNSVRPGLRFGPAPIKHRVRKQSSLLDRFVIHSRTSLMRRRVFTGDEWLTRLTTRIMDLDVLPEITRKSELNRLQLKLHRKGHNQQSLNESLAFAAFTAKQTLNLIPHRTQLVATRELLQGRFAEMGTGEGKTLTMAMAAAVSALDGTPVHVLTASDYLAERDARLLLPLYKALGLSSAFVLPAMSDDQKRSAYQADVVHVTGKQVAFDWLRDTVASPIAPQSLVARMGELASIHNQSESAEEGPLLRGLCLALVDEADSLLIDEARIPLVLGEPVVDDMRRTQELVSALTLARLLHEGVDFGIVKGSRTINLTTSGEDALESLASRIDALWSSARYRNERVREALAVLHCWHRNRDYVVRDNQVQLVDPHNGRAQPDRRLQQGLHTLVELKERCDPTLENKVVASLPFQLFFLNYVRLAGMSGTLREVRAELACVYSVDVVCIPPANPSRLHCLPALVFPTKAAQLQALVLEVKYCQEKGRPVLIGTRTVEESDGVSAALLAHSIAHSLLNASQDAEEAAMIAQAGKAGQVTVATNMAGRGTDIRLGHGVPDLGGLHVVALAFNESCRLDRQLAGRSGRQGAAGSFRKLLCLEDINLRKELPAWVLAILDRLLAASFKDWQARYGSKHPAKSQHANYAGLTRELSLLPGMALANRFVLYFVKAAQRKVERRHANERRIALDSHKQLSKHIAIGGRKDYIT